MSLNFPTASSVGFDRMLRLFASDLDAFAKPSTFPPHNIIKLSEVDYLIEMAVAGYDQEDIEIVYEKNKLEIKGVAKEHSTGEYLCRGLAARSFTKLFTLIDTLVVKDATLKNGILKIELFNDVPEQQKPKRIPINNLELPPKAESKLLVE